MLKDIENQDYPLEKTEVILVDDSSNPPYEFERNYIKLIRNEKSLGAPRSRNLGISKADGKYLMMLDDDLRLSTENYASKAIEILQERDEAAMVVPRKIDRIVEGGEEKFQEYSCNRVVFYSGDLRRKEEERGYVKFGSMTYIAEREIIEKIDGYDPIYGRGIGHSWREESDLQAKVRESGEKIWFEPSIEVEHNIIERGGQDTDPSDMLYWRFHNHLIFLRRHISWWRLRAIGTLIDILGTGFKKDLWAIPSMIRGYLDGWRAENKGC